MWEKYSGTSNKRDESRILVSSLTNVSTLIADHLRDITEIFQRHKGAEAEMWEKFMSDLYDGNRCLELRISGDDARHDKMGSLVMVIQVLNNLLPVMSCKTFLPILIAEIPLN